jgi:dolichol-phosphate mannosyltransferase
MQDPPPVVVIPTFNERENIGPLVDTIVATTTCRVVIVDDGSPDGTGDAADELARASTRVSVLHRRGPRSFAQSYIDGLHYALATGADRVCQMDADGSHDPALLAALLTRSFHADVVVGSRYVTSGAVRDWPLHRRALSAFANRYVRAITGLAVHDATSGFKCWRRDALAASLSSPLRSHGYALQYEMLFHAARAGFSIAEIPIVFVERRFGRSKISWAMIAESVGVPWRLVLAASAKPARTNERVRT